MDDDDDDDENGMDILSHQLFDASRIKDVPIYRYIQDSFQKKEETLATTMTCLANQIETNGATINYTIYINECVATLVLFDGHVTRCCL